MHHNYDLPNEDSCHSPLKDAIKVINRVYTLSTHADWAVYPRYKWIEVLIHAWVYRWCVYISTYFLDNILANTVLIFGNLICVEKWSLCCRIQHRPLPTLNNNHITVLNHCEMHIVKAVFKHWTEARLYDSVLLLLKIFRSWWPSIPKLLQDNAAVFQITLVFRCNGI